MSRILLSDQSNSGASSVLSNSGLVYGTLLGALLGVVITGPHFAQCSFGEVVAAVAMCAAMCGVMGYFAILIIGSAGVSSEETDTASYGRDDDCSDWADDGD